MDVPGQVERGRELYANRAWKDAYAVLSAVDGEALLTAGDLELFATAAYMLGRQEEFNDALERAHQAHLNGGSALRAARSGWASTSCSRARWAAAAVGSAARGGWSSARAATASSRGIS